MADNYLEKREQEVSNAKPKVVRNHPSLESLLKRNRSYRGYDNTRTVSEDDLMHLLEVIPWTGSGMNAQPLRFHLVTGKDTGLLHPLVHLGAALPQEHLPHPGQEPTSYIVICSCTEENRVVDIDLGIAAQSILLRATEMGLGGIFILNFNPQDVSAALGLPLLPLAILAIGKPAERVFLTQAKKGDSLAYYRKEGVHFVPKLQVEDLLI